MAGLSRSAARLHRGSELGAIADHMVGGQHQQQRVISTGGGLKGSDGHRRSGIAAHGLQQNGARLDADLAHLFSHDEAVIVVADHQGIRQALQALQSLLGLLQQRVVTTAA